MKCFLNFCLAILISSNLFSQGCSDAGFCTIGNIQSNKDDTLKVKNKWSIFLTNGIGDQGVYVFTPGIQYEHTADSNWSFQSKITANYASGNLGNAVGLGDLFLSTTYLLKTDKKLKNSFTIGAKLPLNLGDIRNGDKPLPMIYQSSLGTIDLIVGYKAALKRFALNLAWQQPLTGINRNTFLPEYVNTPEAFEYPSSNDFKRKGDVLLRIGYQLIAKKRLNWNTSILSIYHLGEDTYVNGNVSNSPINIAGSAGLTVNITSMLLYTINKSITIGISGGFPIIVRDVRPDGLTRAFSISPELSINF